MGSAILVAKLWSQMISLITSVSVMYSASVVKRAIMNCLCVNKTSAALISLDAFQDNAVLSKGELI